MEQKIKNPSVEAICIVIKIQLLSLITHCVIQSNTSITKYWCRAIDFTPYTCYNTISPVVANIRKR